MLLNCTIVKAPSGVWGKKCMPFQQDFLLPDGIPIRQLADSVCVKIFSWVFHIYKISRIKTGVQ